MIERRNREPIMSNILSFFPKNTIYYYCIFLFRIKMKNILEEIK